MSPSRNRPLCLRCRSPFAGFLWRTASLLLKRRLRLAYRPETCDSGFASLSVIGSLWQRVARSIRVSLRSLSSELHLSQETACRRPETYRSAFTVARHSRGFSGGLRLCCSDFAYARLHWRQHVAVGRGQSPFASGSASWASLADCVSSAQASTSSRFRRRQHVST